MTLGSRRASPAASGAPSLAGACPWSLIGALRAGDLDRPVAYAAMCPQSAGGCQRLIEQLHTSTLQALGQPFLVMLTPYTAECFGDRPMRELSVAFSRL